MHILPARADRAQAITLSGVSIGITLILAGLAVPSASLIQALRVVPEALSGELLEGGTLFKIGLVITGLAMTIFIPVFRRHPSKQEQKSLLWSMGRPQLMLLAGLLIIATILRLYSLGTGLWH